MRGEDACGNALPKGFREFPKGEYIYKRVGNYVFRFKPTDWFSYLRCAVTDNMMPQLAEYGEPWCVAGDIEEVTPETAREELKDPDLIAAADTIPFRGKR